ncbi:hypothetical protein E5676_scaffold107G00460 [Cucumis melo var. makuwa]|uniref:Uncharacterized protein n=1 Tax=Cucumis melo var. makuwa TaxID=1194695 RepID=A0A5D3CGD4_CUCMM|nr:hypothetical protein E6C27_scaffold1290G00180 [Cucumis melo var. makuwa]TYK10963.1 hypothetical protein E5676_scaffold107G00460 [Cucumis melo var. makuwa]
MFDALMEHVIVSNLNGITSITVKNSCRLLRYSYTSKEPTEPENFKSCINKSTIFLFGARARNNTLLLTSPRDERITKNRIATSGRSSINRITNPIGIKVAR